MSASQLRLLTLFVDRPGELITRDELAARLWTDTSSIDASTGINSAINRLRRHLQETPGEPSSIETVIGLGYRFVADVEQIQAERTDDELLHQRPQLASVTAPITHVIPPLRSQDGETSVREASGQPQGMEVRPLPVSGPMRGLATGRGWRVAAIASCFLAIMFLLLARGLFRHPHQPLRKSATATGSDTKAPLIRVTADEDVGNLTAAAVAPDGESVVYADRFGVSVHWFASGAERLLGVRPSFRVERLGWLPSGDGVLMSGTDQVSGRQQVWSLPLQGAYPALLAEDANRATMSPDGSRLVFTRDKDRALWMADANGQHARPLRSSNAGQSFDLLLWNHAGNRLIVTLHQSSGTRRGEIAYMEESAGSGAYECIDPASGQVLTREEGFSAGSGYLLSDGRFYFSVDETPGPTTGEAELMMVRIDPISGHFQDAPRLIRKFAARHAASLTASSTGARYAAVLDRSETDVFIATLRPGPTLSDVVRITRGARQNFPHSWTADAKGILLENDSQHDGGSTNWAIYNQPLDGAKPALIASLPENAAMAQLSPNGQWILFLEFTGSPQHANGIFRIPATGGRIEKVPTQGNIEEFHCSASSTGRCILREAIGNDALVYYELDPVKGMGQEVGRTGWQPNRLGDWGLSADGTTVAAAVHDVQRPAIDLISLAAKPTQMRTIAVLGHGTTLGAMWATDGQLLFVECRTEVGFELLSLNLAGRAKLLRSSPSLIWAVPARDGKKIAFPGLTLSSSVWSSTGP
jgi:DNA-binding winged helix-turn-helix (wHTH) protein/Tol biopolymer transport system component